MTSPKPTNGPDDSYRELIHEVRNLSAAVAMLHTIFVKRTLLYWLLGIETALVVIALTMGGIFISIENNNQNKLVDKSIGSCAVRNAQTNSTRTFLERENTIQRESGIIDAVIFSQLHLHLTSQQQALLDRINKEQAQALQDWHDSQPPNVNCAKIIP